MQKAPDKHAQPTLKRCFSILRILVWGLCQMMQKTNYVLRDYYDQEFNCITVAEIRAFLQYAKPYTPLWMIIVLAVTTGMRCNELLRLSLTMFNKDYTSFRYRISKPRYDKKTDRIILITKHRRVVLDDWVVYHLCKYFELNFQKIPTETTHVYWTPWRDLAPDQYGELYAQKLFPWRDTNSFEAIWGKLRNKLATKGHDVHRVDSISRYQGIKRHTLVCRFHKLRHWALSYYYHTHDRDLKAAQAWIKHESSDTTDGYVHSLAQMGMTSQDLQFPLYALLHIYPDEHTVSLTASVGQKGIHDYYS